MILEYFESFYVGRNSWIELGFPGADDYIGYRVHGFGLLPMIRIYLPLVNEPSVGIQFLLGSAMNLNSTLQSGQDAWNKYHPLFKKKLPGISFLTGIGLRIATFIEINIEFRKSLNGDLSFHQLCVGFVLDLPPIIYI